MSEATVLNMDAWYTNTQAIERLSANSGRPIDSNYPRTLARYGKVRTLPVSRNVRLYSKEDIDAYIVEDRGKKTARINRQKALERKSKKKSESAQA